MNNVVSLHREKRWRAQITYATETEPEVVTHYFEEILDLHLIIEHGTDWNRLVQCVVVLNRHDDGEDQNSKQLAVPRRSEN